MIGELIEPLSAWLGLPILALLLTAILIVLLIKD